MVITIPVHPVQLPAPQDECPVVEQCTWNVPVLLKTVLLGKVVRLKLQTPAPLSMSTVCPLRLEAQLTVLPTGMESVLGLKLGPATAPTTYGVGVDVGPPGVLVAAAPPPPPEAPMGLLPWQLARTTTAAQANNNPGKRNFLFPIKTPNESTKI
jgi:hypothetical protein